MSVYPAPNYNYIFNEIDYPDKDDLFKLDVVNRINNGIMFYRTDGRVYTANNFVFDSNKIGLGTNAPGAVIDIKNNNNVDYLRLLDSSNNYKFYIDSTGKIAINSNTANGYDLNVNGSVFVDQLNINNISVGSNLSLLGDLSVTGTTNLFNTNINTNLFVSGSSTIKSNLLISGNSELKSNLSVSGTAYLFDTNINTNLFVSGSSTIKSNLLISGNSDLRGTLNVSNVSTLRNTNIVGNLGINQSNALTQLQFSNENIYHIRFDNVSAPTPRYYKLTSMIYGGQPVGSFRIYGTLSGDQANDRGSSVINIRFSTRTSSSGDAPTLVGSVLGSVGNVANILIYKDTTTVKYDVYLYITSFCLVDLNLQRLGVSAPLSYDGSYVTTAPSGANITLAYDMQSRFALSNFNDSILYKSTNKDEYTLNRTYSTAGWYKITGIAYVNSFVQGIWCQGFMGGDEFARGNANINITFKTKNNSTDDPIIYGYVFGQLRSDYADIVIYKNTATTSYDVYLYQGYYSNNYITFSKFVGSQNTIDMSSVPLTTTPPGTLVYRLSDNYSTISNNVFYQGARTGFGIGTASPLAGLHVSNTSILSNAVTMGSTLTGNGASTLMSTLNVNDILTIRRGSANLRLEGTAISGSGSACFMEFYPRTIASGRKAYIGFGSNDGTSFTILNQDGGILSIGTSNATVLTCYPQGGVGIGGTPTGENRLNIGKTITDLTASASVISSSVTYSATTDNANILYGTLNSLTLNNSVALTNGSVTSGRNYTLFNQATTSANSTNVASLHCTLNRIRHLAVGNSTIADACAVYNSSVNESIGTITENFATYNQAWNFSTGNIAFNYGQYIDAQNRSSGYVTENTGIYLNAINNNIGTVGSNFGAKIISTNASTGLINLNYGIQIGANNSSSGQVSNNTALRVITTNGASGIVGINRGLQIEIGTTGTITNNHTIYCPSNVQSYHQGNLGLGIAIPTSKLHVVGTTLLDGATTIMSTLNVSGDTNFNNVSINSNLSVSGNAYFNSNVDIDNDAYDYSNLSLNFEIGTVDIPNSSWRSVCWSPTLKIFVAVGNNSVNNNQIINSYDGIIWSIAKSVPNVLTFQSVIWVSDRFVACASDGTSATNRIIISYDGLTWFDTTTLSVSNTWKYLCYSYEINTLVCCADTGASGRIIYSTNRGITWSIGTGYVNTSAYTSIAWSPDLKLFVVTATSGSTPQGTLYTSSNGIAWTASTITTAYQWESVCWATYPINRFVVVSSTSGASQRSMYSSDGINWIFSTSSPTIPLNTWKYVTYNNYLSKLIAVSSDGTNRVMTSTDGNTWTSINVGTANNFLTIDFNESKTLIMSLNATFNNNIVITTNLVNFSQNTNSGLIDSYYNGVDYNSSTNKLIATASLGTTRVIQSTNEGLNWSTNSLSSSYQWLQIIYAGNKWVAVNAATSTQVEHIAYSSNDGVNWSFASSIPQNNSWGCIAYSPSLGRYVSLSYTGTTRVMYSSDAITWINTSASIISNNWTNIRWIPELSKFYAVAQNTAGITRERVAYSSDGLTWSYMPTSFTYTNNWVDIAYSPLLNRYVLISNDTVGLNAFITSQDGLNWSNSNQNGAIPYAGWVSIDWSPDHKKFIACNSSATAGVDRLLWSSDGFNWYKITANIPDYSFRFIKYIPTLKKFLLLASAGADFYKRFLFSYEPTDVINSACLRINNNTKGLLLPSISDVNKNLITYPAEGLTIYNNNQKALNIFDGVSWIGPTFSKFKFSSTSIQTISGVSINAVCNIGTDNIIKPDYFITVNTNNYFFTINMSGYYNVSGYCSVSLPSASGGEKWFEYILRDNINSEIIKTTGQVVNAGDGGTNFGCASFNDIIYIEAGSIFYVYFNSQAGQNASLSIASIVFNKLSS